MAAKKDCYIYVFREGVVPYYVGKGSGRRFQVQKKKFGLDGDILERGLTEEEAYLREVHWISVLKPTLNRNKGGGGSRACQLLVPLGYRDLITEAEMAAQMKQSEAEYKTMEKMGTQKYVAKMMLGFISEANCARFGLSKVDVNRLRNVVYG